MLSHSRKTALVAAVLVGSAVALPGIASASPHDTTTSSTPSATIAPTTTTIPKNFTQAQQQLEQQLAFRQGELTRLGADVTAAAAKSLTDPHAKLLNARLATESASIAALVAKVPTDTTFAQLNSDRAAMLRDNRVFAVMAPQVFETIEADAVAAQVSTLVANESTLSTEVNGLMNQPGYNNALNHYNAYVRAVTHAGTISSNVATSVLAQTPQGFPRNVKVFVHANEALLDADLALAHASYDASVIGLATGGYTGP